eukprot:Opistho-2@49563
MASRSMWTPQEFVRQYFGPLVAVSATADVEAACRANNLSFIELLRPFVVAPNKAYYRDVNGNTRVAENVHMRLLELSKLEPPSIPDVQRLCTDTVAQAHGSAGLTPALSPPPPPPPVARTPRGAWRVEDPGTPRERTPWYDAYWDALLGSLRPADHEYFDHPVAVMAVASTANADPIAALSRAYNPQEPPPSFVLGGVDPAVPKFHVLIHDASSSIPADKVNALVQLMKTYFGTNCTLLTINSRARAEAAGPPAVPDLWEGYVVCIRDGEKEGKSDAVTTTGRSSRAGSAWGGSGATGAPGGSSPHMRAADPLSSGGSLGPLGPLGPLDPSGDGDDGDDAFVESRAYAPADEHAEKRARWLTNDDLGRIQDFTVEFCTKVLVPSLERSLHALNEQVVASKKGIRGSFFSATRKWFGGGGAGATAGTAAPAASGRHNASHATALSTSASQLPAVVTGPEALSRRMADCAFLLQDYDFANAAYHNLRRDYQNEKAWKHYAAAQEAIGLCVLMGDSSAAGRKDPEPYLDSAISTYLTKCALPICASRATFIAAEVLRARGHYREAATVFIRMTGEDSDLRSGLMLEQAAHCFLRMSPAMHRKFAFHMILAGHRYSKSSQRKHALRCYAFALEVYRGRAWSLAEDHIHFTLGRQSFHVGALTDSIAQFAMLLRESPQPPPQQAGYLKEFLYIVKQYLARPEMQSSESVELPILPLPGIARRSLRVLLDGGGAESHSPSADNAWAEMERSLAERTTPQGSYRPAVHVMSDTTNNSERPVCVLGEPVVIEVELVNPLQIPLTMQNLCLRCEFYALDPDAVDSAAVTTTDGGPPKAGDGKAATAASPPTSAGDGHGEAEEDVDDEDVMASAHSGTGPMMLESDPGLVVTAPRGPSAMPPTGQRYIVQVVERLQMEPEERKKVRLSVTPNEEGYLYVQGIEYVLAGSVRGRRDFAVRGPRIKKAKPKGPRYGPDRRLQLVVTSAMPLLRASLEGVPETMYLGEVRRVRLSITNGGRCAMAGVRMRASDATFLCKAVPDGGLVGQHSLFLEATAKAGDAAANGGITVLAEAEMLPPGATIVVDAWVRGDALGRRDIGCVFLYESERPSQRLRYRTACVGVHTTVQPSLLVTGFVRPSAASAEGQICAVEVENMQASAEFRITQVSAVAPVWKLRPLGHVQTARHTLGPREMLSLYYGMEYVTADSAGALICSNLSMAGDAAEPLFDCSRPPHRDMLLGDQADDAGVVDAVGGRRGKLELGSRGVAVVVFWEVPGRACSGQMHVRITDMQASPAAGESPVLPVPRPLDGQGPLRTHARIVASDGSLRVLLQHPDVVKHAFVTGRMCRIPVELAVHNAGVRATNLVVEFLQPKSDKSGGTPAQPPPPSSSSSSSQFLWVGRTSLHAALAAGETFRVALSAAVTGPGVYDMARLRVFASTAELAAANAAAAVVPSHPSLLRVL